MRSQSAYDDLVGNTLSRVFGALTRLEYVSGLRDPDGQYFHWGLARTHGEQAARNAIAEAHAQLFASILRVPLARLSEQAWNTCRELSLTPQLYLRQICNHRGRMVPRDASGAAVLHFSLVLDALLSLAEAR
jgi:hypothetical protein